MTESLKGNTCINGVACFNEERLKTIFKKSSLIILFYVSQKTCDLKRIAPRPRQNVVGGIAGKEIFLRTATTFILQLPKDYSGSLSYSN